MASAVGVEIVLAGGSSAFGRVVGFAVVEVAAVDGSQARREAAVLGELPGEVDLGLS
jgi:hypothetical protein